MHLLQISKNYFKMLLNHLPKSFPHCIKSTLFSISFCIPAVCIIFEIIYHFFASHLWRLSQQMSVCTTWVSKSNWGSYVSPFQRVVIWAFPHFRAKADVNQGCESIYIFLNIYLLLGFANNLFVKISPHPPQNLECFW